MNQEFQKHQKSDGVKWISVLICVVLLAVSVSAALTKGFTDFNPYGWFDEKSENEQPVDDKTVEVANARVFLSVGEAMAATDGISVSRTITATVLPVDAVNKAVDWSISWGTDATRASEDVKTYVDVVPSGDGSESATVYCYKSFEGDIAVITVTTRLGGFTSYCTVQYAGLPETLLINTTECNKVNDTVWNAEMIEMLCGSTTYLPITLDNTLHQVGESFANNYKVSLEAHGSIQVKNESYDSAGTYTGTTYSEYEMYVADLWDSNQYCYTAFQKSGGLHSHVKASIENGQLKIEAQDAITAYSAVAAGRGGRAEMSFNAYVDDKIPYTTITITETSTGISYSINIRTIPSVTSVALSSSSLTF